jgi:hypothetical protein
VIPSIFSFHVTGIIFGPSKIFGPMSSLLAGGLLIAKRLAHTGQLSQIE